MKFKIITLSVLATINLTIASAQDTVLRDVEIIPTNDAVDIQLDIADGRDEVRIGDRVSFCFKVSRSGYVSLWDIGTSGRVGKIYPFKEKNQKYYVEADKKQCVGEGRMKVTGPTGQENVVLYWTEDSEGQIHEKSYRNIKKFVDSLESHTKDIVLTAPRRDGWDGWATAKTTFNVIDKNGYQTQPDIDMDDLARTRSQYDNVYMVAFGANVGKLKKTNDDAKMAIEMVESTLHVPSSNTKLYTNAYKKDFKKGMAWLKENAGKNDLVIFYYSGHGTTLEDDNNDETDKLDEALVPYDVEKGYNDVDSYIRDDELVAWFNEIKSGAVVALFDACHSGGMHKGFARGDLVNARTKFFSKGIAGQSVAYKGGIDDISTAQSRDIIDSSEVPENGHTRYAFLAAAGEYEYALELPGHGGLFTLGLQDALSKADNKKDWSEMVSVLSRNVLRASKGRQTPNTVDANNVLETLTFD